MSRLVNVFVSGLVGAVALGVVILAMLIQALPIALAIFVEVWMLRSCS